MGSCRLTEPRRPRHAGAWATSGPHLPGWAAVVAHQSGEQHGQRFSLRATRAHPAGAAVRCLPRTPRWLVPFRAIWRAARLARSPSPSE